MQAARELFRSAQRRAKKKKVACNITLDWVAARVENGACELSGIPFELAGVRNAYQPSIHRLNNNRGYTKRNCKVVCWGLNAAISDFGEDIFASIAKRYLKAKSSQRAA
jgi:hypothetical protein